MAATEKRAVRERASPGVWRERVERWVIALIISPEEPALGPEKVPG